MLIKVNKEGEARLLRRHPWVLKEHIRDWPPQLRPGQCVDFFSEGGDFLAFGYCNPRSKISGRVLTFEHSQRKIAQPENLRESFKEAWKKRSGFRGSFRWVYGEGDSLPGWIVDRYVVSPQKTKPEFQVLVLQESTLGAEKLIADPLSFFRPVVEDLHKNGLSDYSWDQTGFVLRNDLRVRQAEGLKVDIPRVLKTQREWDLTCVYAWLNHPLEETLIPLNVDLYQGQKTGLFLDQTKNIKKVTEILIQSPKRRVKILDLCCYVGSWSSHLSRALCDLGFEIEVTLFDASKKALERAQENIDARVANLQVICGDVLKDLKEVSSESYDLVICDPPAFVKNKKDLVPGLGAYIKINAEAQRITKSGGLLVTCSCSGLVSPERFQGLIEKSQKVAGVQAELIFRGENSEDHPYLNAFPEGKYLKMMGLRVLRIGQSPGPGPASI